MIYFEYITFFVILTGALLYILRQWLRIGEDHFQKLALKAIFRQRQENAERGYVNSVILMQIIKILRKTKDGKATRLKLSEGKPAAAEAYLKKHNYPLEAFLLAAHYDQQKALPKLEKLAKKEPENQVLLAALAEIYFNLKQPGKASLALAKINPKKAPAHTQGIYWFYQSQEAAQNGDMLAATQACSKAVHLFGRCGAYAEEARAYLWQGTLYRVCFVEDVAQFMFEAARKIYRIIGCPAGEAEALANLGMLTTAQERFEEAEDYFARARQIALQSECFDTEAEIINQSALMKLVAKDYITAEKYLKEAIKIHRRQKNDNGLALSYELRANLSLARKKYDDVLSHSRKAAKIYQTTANIPAFLESLYLQAQALFAQEEDSETERLLRKIIETGQMQAGSFHIANAYSLLGLLFLRQGDLRRAKGLFQQSLEQEQKNDRYSGIATDYANIGLIELRAGHKEDALKNLQAAAQYAEEAGEEKLSGWLTEQIKDLKSQLN